MYKIKVSVCITYQDDSLLLSLKNESKKHAEKFIDLAQDVGLEIKRQKSVINSTRVKWLGLVYYFSKKTITPSTKRIDSILRLIEKILRTKLVILTDLQCVLGKLSSLSIAGWFNLKALIFNVRSLDGSDSSRKLMLNSVHCIELEMLQVALNKMRTETIIKFDFIKFLINSKCDTFFQEERPLKYISDISGLIYSLANSKNIVISYLMRLFSKVREI